MSELGRVEARIQAALDRIAMALDDWKGGGPDPDEIAAMKAEIAASARAQGHAEASIELEPLRLALAEAQDQLTKANDAAEQARAALARKEEADRDQPDAQALIEAADVRASTAEGLAEQAQAALAEEQANATHLREEVERLKDQQNGPGVHEQRAQRLQDMANMQARDLARLRKVNSELRDTIRALREAASAGELNGDDMNQALQAELDATRAQQAADRSELDAILAELSPLIQEKADV